MVDIHFSIAREWVQNVVYMSNDRNWSLFLLFYRHRRFFIRFCLFFVLIFNFFGFLSFVITTLDKFQFRSQVRPSQINVIISIGLKLRLYAVLIKKSCRINFLFVGRQDIINYWDFPSKISRDCHKRLVPKII